jgi:hypothetical protein
MSTQSVEIGRALLAELAAAGDVIDRDRGAVGARLSPIAYLAQAREFYRRPGLTQASQRVGFLGGHGHPLSTFVIGLEEL